MGKLITIRFWYRNAIVGDRAEKSMKEKCDRVKMNKYTGNQKPYDKYYGRVLVILDNHSIGNIDDIIMIGNINSELIQILIDDEWMVISEWRDQ